MKHSVQFILMAVALGCALPPVFAESPVERRLGTAQIMPKGYAFRVTDNGAEATVQTYQSSTSPLPSDMKIDAVLIGKQVIDELPKIAKIKVVFYKPDRVRFNQVVVTAADIAAYGLGGISKEKLLQGLEITTFGDVDPSFKEATVERLRFSYPSNWTLKSLVSNPEMFKSGYLAEIDIPAAASWAKVNIRKQFEAPSLSQQASWDESYANTHGFSTKQKRPVQIGRTQMVGFELLTRGSDSANPTQARYQQHIYFGKPHAVYSMTLDCQEADAQKFGPTFTKVLNSLYPLR